MRIFLALIALLLPFQAWAEETSYFDLDIPVMDGAENVKHERNETFFTVSVEYDLKFKDIDDVYDFYNAFFKEHGQKSFSENIPTFEKKWSATNIRHTENDEPRYAAGAMWVNENPPFNSNVSVIISDFKDNQFFAEISVFLVPYFEPNFSDMESNNFTQFLIEDPKNIFLLHDLIGGDPFQVLNFNPKSIGKEKMNLPLVQAYMKFMEQNKAEFEEFGAQYVLKTKPVDGKFKGMMSRRAELEETDPLYKWAKIQEERAAKGQDAFDFDEVEIIDGENEEEVSPVPDWVEDFVKEKQEQKSQSKKEEEDPLHKWRRLQEERVKREMKEKELENEMMKKQFEERVEEELKKRGCELPSE